MESSRLSLARRGSAALGQYDSIALPEALKKML